MPAGLPSAGDLHPLLWCSISLRNSALVRATPASPLRHSALSTEHFRRNSMRRLIFRLAAVVTIMAMVAGTGIRTTATANSPANRLDLAAMALDGSDLPEGALLYLE